MSTSRSCLVILLALALRATPGCSSAGGGGNDAASDGAGEGTSDGSVPIGQNDTTPGPGADTDQADTPQGNPDVTAPPDTSGGEYVSGACEAGAVGCLDATTVAICANGIYQPGQICSNGGFCIGGVCAVPGPCTPGSLTGCESLGAQLRCNAAGDASVPEYCPGQQLCADGQCRDVACTPGVTACTDFTKFHACKADGSGFEPEQQCEVGTCTGGKCLTLCETNIKFTSNIGCEYWSVDLDNDTIHNPVLPNQLTPEMFPHSVIITNPNDGVASVTFTVAVTCADGSACSPTETTCGGKKETICATGAAEYDLSFPDSKVPAHDSREFKMPVMNLRGSAISPKGIRIRSSLPVIAYQFNPFNSENAASNDGSLLLPRNGLGKHYFAVSLPTRGAIFGFPENPGFLTVVSTATGPTSVSVTPTVDVTANPAAGVPQDGTTPAILPAFGTYTFTLKPFEVLNLQSTPTTEIIGFGKVAKDLTGTRIDADQPIAVFGGHQASGITDDIKVQFQDEWDSCCTEHLEEQLMPVETWGKAAFCVKSKPRGYEIDQWFVVSGEDNVQLTTDPPIDGINGKTMAKAGERVRLQTDESFMLTATGKIQVVQFLVAQGMTQPKNSGTFGTGDPSMMIIPPKEQYRDNYVIRTADGYSENWTTVVRPKGLEIKRDGAAIPDSDFDGFGDGSWEYAYVKVDKGTHEFESATGTFGLMVYGYGGVTAYGYPGGMNLSAE